MLLTLVFSNQSKAQKSIQLTQKHDGTYELTCKVNGLPFKFIFDTGASEVTLSLKAARELHKIGELQESDIIGVSNYKLADGGIVSGTNILIRHLTIGHLNLYNVRAVVLERDDIDFLLGQSALQKLGSYRIDYTSHKLIFESGSEGKVAEKLDGALIDIQGTAYRTVRIGSQVWMAENIRVEKFLNGDPIPFITDDDQWEATSSAGQCFLENNITYDKFCGRLYNHFTITDSRGVCPSGWRVPTSKDFQQLFDELGGIEVASIKLKSDNISFWRDGAGNNLSLFSALPCGYRSQYGQYFPPGRNTFYWTSTVSTYSYYGLKDIVGPEIVGISGHDYAYFGNVTDRDANSGAYIRCIRR